MMKINSTIDGDQKISFEADEKNPFSVDFGSGKTEIKVVEKISETTSRVDYLGKKYLIKVLDHDPILKTATLKVNGDIIELKQENEFDELLKSLGMGAGAVKKVNDMKAPMPGVVIDVKVEAGQSVSKDEGIVVLEAMKMENLLKSPIDGVIKSIEITKGDTVEKNKVLVNFE